MSTGASVHIANLTVVYGSGPKATTVIQDLCMDFASPGIHVVMGANGCGKSTLLKTLAGAISPSSGTVRLARDLTTMRREWIPQDYRQAIFPWRSVRWNLEFGRAGRYSQQRIDQISRQMRIDELIERYPSDLSGGQQQRLMLSRTLLADAQLVIADEPFSALDALSRLELIPMFRKAWLASGATVIVALHEPECAASLGDRVALFDGPPLACVHSIERAACDDDQKEFEIQIREQLQRTPGAAHAV